MGFGLGICGSCCTTVTPSCGTLCFTSTGCISTILPGVGITLTYKSVTSVAVSNGGSGYTVKPNVTFATTNGSGAVATAVLTGGVVTSITVTTGGAYTTAPVVTLSGGSGGSGATAGASTLGSPVTVGTGTTTGQVTAIAVANNGSGYTAVPTVTIGGVGTGATAVALIGGAISSASVDNAGSGYTTAPTATISTTTGSAGSIRVLLTASTLDTVAVATGGVYSTGTAIPTITLATPTGHTGSGAAASPRMGLLGVFVGTSGGTGYTVGDVLTVAGGTSTVAATATVTAVSGGVVTALSTLVSGTYTAYPTAPIGTTGGTGTGCTLSVNWKVSSIVVTAAGTNYSTAPTATFSSGSATATPALVATTIASATVVSGGLYSAPPAVTLTGGGGGTLGAVSAAIASYGVRTITVTANGSGYVAASTTVTITPAGGGAGSGATGTPTVVVRTCFSIPTAGNYSYTATAPSGSHYANATGTAAANCSNAVGVNLNAATGYSCTQNACCPANQPDSGPGPYDAAYFPPDTWYLNDGLGTITMTRAPITYGTNVWYGCATRSAAQVIADCLVPLTYTSGSINMYFQSTCFSGPGGNSGMFIGICLAGCKNYTGNVPPHDCLDCFGTPTAACDIFCISGNMTTSCVGFTFSGSGPTFVFSNPPLSGQVGHFQVYGTGTTFSASA